MVSMGSGTTMSLLLSTPLFENVSTLKCDGTQISLTDSLHGFGH